MRRIEVERHWTRLRSRASHALAVREIRLEGLQGFRDDVIAVGQPIFAICGQNGSGKTVLLRAVMAVLRWPEISQRPQFAPRLSGSRLTLHIERRAAGPENLVLDWRAIDEPVGDQSERAVSFFDPAQEVPRIQHFFQEMQDLDDFIGAYGERELNADIVRALSYATQKQYESIRVYEIDDIEIIEGTSSDVIPFFRIKEAGVNYDTRTASLGEQAILYIHWKLSTCEPGSFLLIEEPETFLSEFSQSELLDLIAEQASSRDLTVMYSTHSPRLIHNLNDDEVTFLYRSAEGVKIAGEAARSRLKLKLGYSRKSSRVIVVEDNFARSFFRAICERLDPELLADVEIAGNGGSQNIDRLRASFPPQVERVRLAYVYDGDMRDKLGEPDARAFALPGDGSPERVLRNFIAAKPDLIASRISIPVEDFEMKLAELHGRNDHDWLPELAASYSHTLDTFVRLVIECWLMDGPNLTGATELLTDVRSALF